MKELSDHLSLEPDTSREQGPEYLSVKEAARIIGVSERSVYGYVEAGKLPSTRIENIIMVSAEHVHTYQRIPPGRLRTTTPPWHIPPLKNPHYLTTIKVRVRPGQSEMLDHKLSEMRVARRHLLPGTAARYITRGHDDPDQMIFLLIWCNAAMPSEEERETAFAALTTDLADVLDWKTAVSIEGQVLLHA